MKAMPIAVTETMALLTGAKLDWACISSAGPRRISQDESYGDTNESAGNLFYTFIELA